jgi:AcrR family transcriptional regulator
MGTDEATGSRGSAKRASVIAAAESLILANGHASITYRSIAESAGVTAGLVHYYFPTLDQLFIAVLTAGSQRILDYTRSASRSDQPLRSVWEYTSSPSGTAMLLEFMAIANHRPAVREAIGQQGESVRQALLDLLSKTWARKDLGDNQITPPIALFLLTAIPRMAFLEESLGTHTGHEETFALVEQFLDRVEPRT